VVADGAGKHDCSATRDDATRTAGQRTGALRRAAEQAAAPLRHFPVQAALPTVPVLLAIGVLWSNTDGWLGFVATDIPLLAALTLPRARRHLAGPPVRSREAGVTVGRGVPGRPTGDRAPATDRLFPHRSWRAG